MSYETKQFILSPGALEISSVKFIARKIHMVSRRGVVQRQVAGSPTGGTREFQHNSSLGKLIFGVPGAPLGERGDPEPRELVQVTFEE